jgi:hypothetical protein
MSPVQGRLQEAKFEVLSWFCVLIMQKARAQNGIEDRAKARIKAH